jgi:hypothetical protein
MIIELEFLFNNILGINGIKLQLIIIIFYNVEAIHFKIIFFGAKSCTITIRFMWDINFLNSDIFVCI